MPELLAKTKLLPKKTVEIRQKKPHHLTSVHFPIRNAILAVSVLF